MAEDRGNMPIKESAPEISVILPVYNVEDYVDVCMESLVRQTYGNMEILLINDGSTDASAEKCAAWRDRDPRVVFIDKKNEGVAATRNLGVQMARGKYLAFVDPDDWLDLSYMEKLHTRLEETGADFAECDLWRYDNRSGKKIYRCCYGRMGQAYSLREHMIYGPTASYKAMSRRELWIQNGIQMPSVSFESPAVYALVLALSNRVENIREPLYYYRRFRENSLIENGYAAKDGTPNNRLGIEAMEFLMDEFRRCGLYDAYQDTLERVVKYRLNDILAMQFHRKPKEDFRILVRNYHDFLKQAFPDGRNDVYITWGGYNLNRILTHMNWLHDPYCRFNFSSMVSVSDGNTRNHVEICHKNHYRQMMLEREREGSIWQVVKEKQPRFLFMDLMEERFDLLEQDDQIWTLSDALAGSGTGQKLNGRVIPRDSEECRKLWRKAAKDFFRHLQTAAPGIRIVVLEDLLSERTGDLSGTEPFQNLEEIRKINRILTDDYAYLRELCPDALFIQSTQEQLYFTDKNYEYGAIPSHLNEIVNQRIAQRIEKALSCEITAC